MGDNFFSSWKVVFGNWKYALCAIIIALVFYSINVIVPSWRSLIAFYHSTSFLASLKFFYTLFVGFKETIEFHSFISTVVISLMLGILFSLIFFKSKAGVTSGKKRGLLGGLGIFLGVFAPGCAACGVGLASVLGVGAGVIAVLPFDGLELSVLAIIVLAIAIFKISKDLTKCETCQVKLTKETLKGGKK